MPQSLLQSFQTTSLAGPQGPLLLGLEGAGAAPFGTQDGGAASPDGTRALFLRKLLGLLAPDASATASKTGTTVLSEGADADADTGESASAAMAAGVGADGTPGDASDAVPGTVTNFAFLLASPAAPVKIEGGIPALNPTGDMAEEAAAKRAAAGLSPADLAPPPFGKEAVSRNGPEPVIPAPGDAFAEDAVPAPRTPAASRATTGAAATSGFPAVSSATADSTPLAAPVPPSSGDARATSGRNEAGVPPAGIAVVASLPRDASFPAAGGTSADRTTASDPAFHLQVTVPVQAGGRLGDGLPSAPAAAGSASPTAFADITRPGDGTPPPTSSEQHSAAPSGTSSQGEGGDMRASFPPDGEAAVPLPAGTGADANRPAPADGGIPVPAAAPAGREAVVALPASSHQDAAPAAGEPATAPRRPMAAAVRNAAHDRPGLPHPGAGDASGPVGTGTNTHDGSAAGSARPNVPGEALGQTATPLRHSAPSSPMPSPGQTAHPSATAADPSAGMPTAAEGAGREAAATTAPTGASTPAGAATDSQAVHQPAHATGLADGRPTNAANMANAANASDPANRPFQPPEPAGRQLEVQLVRHAAAGRSRFTVRLDPPELGRVQVSLQFSGDGRVEASIRADHPHALDMLQRDARMLERALAQAGFRTEGGLQFSLNQHSSQQQPGHGHGHPTTGDLPGQGAGGGTGQGDAQDRAAAGDASGSTGEDGASRPFDETIGHDGGETIDAMNAARRIRLLDRLDIEV